MTQSDSDTSNDMSYEDVCAIAWKGFKVGKGAGKKGLGQGRGIVDRKLMSGRVAEEMTGHWKQRRRQKQRSKPDIATIAESKGISE